jgi:hypothetical protein
MIMGAHTVITHAQNQGVTLAKITDGPALPQVLIMDAGQCRGRDTVALVRVSLVRDVVCGWCDEPATRVATGAALCGPYGYSDYMCAHHAYVWGRFVPVHVVVPVPGHGVAALCEDWGFVEIV